MIFKFLLLLLVPITMYTYLNYHPNIPIVEEPKYIRVSETSTLPLAANNSKSLKDVLTPLLKSYKGQYSVVVKNLRTGENFYYNQNQKYQSASLYKLWVMGAIYQLVNDGKLSLQNTRSVQISDLISKYNIDGSYVSRKNEFLTFKIQDALNKMISVSDNDTGIFLTDVAGIDAINNFIRDNKFLDSDIGSGIDQPMTSGADISSFFEKLYLGTLVSKSSSDGMLNLLLHQEVNNKLPLNLPYGTKIAHKTGELSTFSHDAGVVYSPNADYIVVVLTDTDDWKIANKNISEISGIVYDYFNEK